MSLFKKKNLKVLLTANASPFEGNLWDLNTPESIITFEGIKFPSKGVTCLFEIDIDGGKKVEGTGKINSVTQPDKEKISFFAEIKYNQLRSEDIELLNQYFAKIQADSLKLNNELSGND